MQNAASNVAAEFGDLSLWLNAFAEQEEEIVDVWWRDDDACDVTDQLEKMIDLSDKMGIPVLLAVIPATLKPALIKRLENASRRIFVAQHGYSHENHASDGKSEFPVTREYDKISADLLKGRCILERAFGDRFLPILVAPFNNWPRAWIPTLKELGFSGLSTSRGLRPMGSFEMDIHIDLLQWLPSGPIMNAEEIDSQTRAWFEKGRKARSPIGLMTHHLRMKRPGDFELLEAYLTSIRNCKASRFTPPHDIFARQLSLAATKKVELASSM